MQQASFHIAGRKVNAVALPPAFSLDEWPRHVYLAFEFDNNESWNRYELDATLDLTLSVAGATSRVSRRLAHRWSGPHKTVSTLDRPPPPPASDGGVPPDAASARGAP